MDFRILANSHTLWNRVPEIRDEFEGFGAIHKVSRYTQSSGNNAMRIVSTKMMYVIHVRMNSKKALNLFKLKHYDEYKYYQLETPQADEMIADEVVWIYNDDLPMDMIEATI